LLTMASTLFHEVAYRAAFDVDLGGALLDFAVELFFSEAGFALDFFALERVATADDAALPRDVRPRTRVPGASFTGSATASNRPGFTAFDDR